MPGSGKPTSGHIAGMEPMDANAQVDLPVIVVGSGRLPKAVAGDDAGSLMVELQLDPRGGRILDVATTVSLPGYTRLLQSLLIGRRPDEIEHVAQQLGTVLRGPLLKPTVAALMNAVANSESVRAGDARVAAG